MTIPTPVPSVTLNNGVLMPILGFGVFQIPAEQTQEVVEQALAAGYRHLDTASSTATRRLWAPRSGPAACRARSCS